LQIDNWLIGDLAIGLIGDLAIGLIGDWRLAIGDWGLTIGRFLQSST
jgi:hypothetical protein